MTNVKLKDFPLLSDVAGVNAPIAIAVATNKSEKEVLEAVQPFADKSKMTPSEVRQVLKNLRVRFRNRSMRTLDRRNSDRKIKSRISETHFREELAEEDKKYLVMNHNHAWVIDGKKIVDPTWDNPKRTRRRLTKIYEIEGAQR